MQIHPVGVELFHAGGWAGGQTDKRTNMMKLTVAFRNFANAPKHENFSPRWVNIDLYTTLHYSTLPRMRKQSEYFVSYGRAAGSKVRRHSSVLNIRLR